MCANGLFLLLMNRSSIMMLTAVVAELSTLPFVVARQTLSFSLSERSADVCVCV